MLNRWLGILLLCGMLLANWAIFMHDVWPRWLPDEPPPTAAHLLNPGQSHETQVGIFDRNGRNIGRSWSRTERLSTGGFIRSTTTTILEPIALPNGIATPRVRIETAITYRPEEKRVDDVDFQMHGIGVPVWLKAEAMPSGEFPGRWQVGPRSGTFSLDARIPALLADVIRPFDYLPELYVGRTWRVDLLDPLAQLLPGFDARQLAPEPIVIRVTEQTQIDHRGERLDVFVVEGEGAKAFVALDGRVLRQEVQLPLLGKLVLLDERYDFDARMKALNRVPDVDPSDRAEPDADAAAAPEP